MAKSIPCHAAGTEVLRRQHAPGRHDAHERVECRFVGVLEEGVSTAGNGALPSDVLLTTQLSRDAASAPELETSSAMPLRFLRMSCNFSKFVRGGGRCRLSVDPDHR